MPTFTVVPASGRPVTVRPQPSDTLQSVVAAACAQIPNAASPEAYALQYNGKTLSLSLAVRLANLPQGARLALHPAAGAARGGQRAPPPAAPVKVALQIVGSGRVIDEFAPSATLWAVLTAAEARSSGTLNLTARYGAAEQPAAAAAAAPARRGMAALARGLCAGAAGPGRQPSPAGRSLASASPGPASPGDVVYKQPVLLLLNKEFAGYDQLQSTTLRSLGLAGESVVARLSFRDAPISAAGPPSDPAMPLPAPEAAAAAAPPAPGAAAAPASARQVRVFEPPAPTAAAPEPRLAQPVGVDPDEAKILVSAQMARQAASERGFKSRLDDEAQAQRRSEQYQAEHPKTTIRFRFPDQVQVRATFLSSDRVAELYTFAASILADPRLLAGLVLQPPVQDLAGAKEQSLFAAKLAPAAVVHVRLAGDPATRPSTLVLLRPSVGALSEPLQVPAVTGGGDGASEGDGAANPGPIPAASASNDPPLPQNGAPRAPAPAPAPPAASRAPAQGAGPRMPKWFTAGQRRH
ncbi:hypothetical protein H4R18_000461 [Coemansia javaensis]|uniref:TUG ubiquitin-like domain-containing protein n=1 Tax=Coemansia javaensis TaxID=2761396 RepID=A0A9W8HPF1_9FUNG|nr:hypothetical protein H4R18_000461 [Coemansia javaensis]